MVWTPYPTVAQARYIYPCLTPQARAVVDLLLGSTGEYLCIPRVVVRVVYVAAGGTWNTSEWVSDRAMWGLDPTTCPGPDDSTINVFATNPVWWIAAQQDYIADPWSRCECPKLSWPNPPWRDPCKDP